MAAVEDYTLRQRRGESSQDPGDQAGRDAGTKKKDEVENEPLDDLQPNEDERGLARGRWILEYEGYERPASA